MFSLEATERESRWDRIVSGLRIVMGFGHKERGEPGRWSVIVDRFLRGDFRVRNALRMGVRIVDGDLVCSVAVLIKTSLHQSNSPMLRFVTSRQLRCLFYEHLTVSTIQKTVCRRGKTSGFRQRRRLLESMDTGRNYPREP